MMQIMILLLAMLACSFLAEWLQKYLSGKKIYRFSKKRVLLRLACSAVTAAAAAGIWRLAAGQLSWSNGLFPLLLLLPLAVNLFFGLIKARRLALKTGRAGAEHPLRRELYVVCALLLLTVLLELTVFNFRAIESLRFEPAAGYTVSGAGIQMTQREDGSCSLRTNGRTIEFLDLNEEIQNMYLRVQIGEKRSSVATVELFATDEANHYYFALPQKTVSSSVERTQYFRMHLSGRSEKLKIILPDLEAGEEAAVDVCFNTQVPYRISLLRIAFVFAAAAFFYLIRPKSPLYRYRLHWNFPWQRALIFGYVALQFLLLAGLTAQNGSMVNAQQNYAHHSQYQELARAMARGEFYIDDQPAESLRAMENPYDTALRNQVVVSEAQESYRWDTSYYEGKYYVYFGVLPVLLFYLPFYLLTGLDFQTVWGIIICEAFWVLGVVMLLGALAKKYFRKTPLLVFLLLCMTFVNGGGLLFIAQSPSFYCLPVLLAAVLAVWALYFWLSALEGARLSKGRLFAGALCAALTAASRPQFLIVCLPAVALFWGEVFQKRTLLSKKGFRETVCLAVPFFLVAAGVMYYNAARFGSVFDFGANYNLTTNDMTRRGMIWDRVPLGLFTYLFQPPVISSQFPYLQSVPIATSYMGRTITEPFFGGILPTNLILLFGLSFRRVRSELKGKRLYAFCGLALIAGAIIAVADTEMAGLLQRYITDFTWLFALTASIVAMALYEKLENRQVFFSLFAAFCALSLVYDMLLYFSQGGTSISRGNPTLYYTVSSIIQFWA